MPFNPIDYPLTVTQPGWVSGTSAWIEHIPFAFTLIEMLHPKLFVELGTHAGDSYCAFCEAAALSGSPTQCFAVDTWKGDEQSRSYDAEVLTDLRAHHDPRYGSFSTLIQVEFDQAVQQFADGSIDLLHIDGFHSYEAVSHDFETWRPKLSNAAAVLFHDTFERKPGFGVWRFWEEISRQFPAFNFEHGHGLGILALGSQPPPPLMQFIETGRQNPRGVRRFYAGLGAQVTLLKNYLLLSQFSREQLEFLDQWKRHIGLSTGSIVADPRQDPLDFSQIVTKELRAIAQDDLRVRAELNNALAQSGRSPAAMPASPRSDA